MLQELDLSMIQRLPQTDLLHSVVNDLWQNRSISAIWLGGSLARGTGDAYSDVDLRVALPATEFDLRALPPGAERIASRVVARYDKEFGADAALHQLLLDDGQIYDMFVQTTTRTPDSERRLVIACRDAEFGAKLLGGDDPVLAVLQPANPDQIRQLIAEYWIGFNKHRKVIERGLDLLAWHGEQLLRGYLLRLYHVLAIGADCGSLHAMTIHSMSPAVRGIQKAFGDMPLAELGRPMRTREELIRSAAAVGDEVARVGRLLSDRLGFTYPVAAEAAARPIGKSHVQ